MTDSYSNIIEVTIKKVVFEGYGLAQHEGLTLFVSKGLPGDIVSVQIIKKRRKIAYAKIIHIISPSHFRDKAHCPHVDCGGCQFIDVDYTHQQQLKIDMLKDAISYHDEALLSILSPLRPTLTQQYHRNKMEFAFFNSDNRIECGLKKRHSYKDMLPVPQCILQSIHTQDILTFSTSFFSNSSFSVYNQETRQGQLRHLMVRHSKATDTFMINIMASNCSPKDFKDYTKTLMSSFQFVSSVNLCSIHEQPGTPTKIMTHPLGGSPYLEETCGHITCHISPQSFFQTNTSQMKVLYDTIEDVSQLTKEDTLLDLYCGTGTIGLYLARRVNSIIGIEENEHAIQNAYLNAKTNAINNISFHTGRVKNILKFNTFSADCLIVDPPRSGIVPKALKRIIELNTPRLTYVSCHPISLLRDLKILQEAGYTVNTWVPVDMFPHTYHIESVVHLTLN